MKTVESACFMTFTYADAPLSKNGFPTLVKRDFQNFLKRLRKKLPKEPYITKSGKTGYRTKLKYYACGEYGSQYHRPHYHAILFNLPMYMIYNPTIVAETWDHGTIDIAPANQDTIHYVTKYIMKSHRVDEFKNSKIDLPTYDPYSETFSQPFQYIEKSIVDMDTGELFEDDRIPQFSLMSKNLGKNYLTKQMINYHKSNLISYVTNEGGFKQPLPRYYRDRIFTDFEKDLLNQQAEFHRNVTYEKLFNSNPEKKLTWKLDQVQKFEKSLKLERQSL